jgi:hypothetical protein
MGDHSEYEMETLAAIDNSEDPQAVSSPVTTPAATAPVIEPKKSKGKLSIFSWHKKNKTDKSVKASTVPETAAESSKSGENAAPTEEVVPPLETADDAAFKTVSRLSPIIFDDNHLAGPSSSAPPLAEEVVPDADVLFQMPKIPSQSGRRRANRPNTEDKEARYPLKIPEELGDYPHINSPRTLKHFGPLPYAAWQVEVPLAKRWIDQRHIAKYAGDPLFKLSKACPYILVPLVLAARLQLIVESPIILPTEVRELAAERGLDVDSLEGYDIALLNILGALWDD